ncbi:MAG: hypothetical protein JXC36_08705 [Candidatus Atribacteria bacterium]|nr:hypothetical protein [Candidatus Atribacteria bacterium]
MAQLEPQSSTEELFNKLASRIAEIKRDVIELKLDVSTSNLDVGNLKEAINKIESSKDGKNKTILGRKDLDDKYNKIMERLAKLSQESNERAEYWKTNYPDIYEEVWLKKSLDQNNS